MKELIEKIERFVPINEQEEADKKIILHFLKTQNDIFLRSSLSAHMTASAWVVNRQRTKVLMAYHNIYNSWAWLGGHADGEADLLSVALREAKEESGIRNVSPVTEDIFSLEVIAVEGHEKKGEYVPSHLHLNVTYLLEADESESLKIREDENSAVGWLTFDEVIEKSSEPWFYTRIYPKLITRSSSSF